MKLNSEKDKQIQEVNSINSERENQVKKLESQVSQLGEVSEKF